MGSPASPVSASQILRQAQGRLFGKLRMTGAWRLVGRVSVLGRDGRYHQSRASEHRTLILMRLRARTPFSWTFANCTVIESRAKDLSGRWYCWWEARAPLWHCWRPMSVWSLRHGSGQALRSSG